MGRAASWSTCWSAAYSTVAGDQVVERGDTDGPEMVDLVSGDLAMRMSLGYVLFFGVALFAYIAALVGIVAVRPSVPREKNASIKEPSQLHPAPLDLEVTTMRWLAMAGALLVGVAACSGDDESMGDTGPDLSDEELMCLGELGDPEVLIGEGIGGAFQELEDGAQVGLEIAPQGGFGVSVAVRTTGLRGDAPALVTVRTEIDGVESASFTFEQDGEPTQQLFCQDDGRSALGAGIAVGFSAADYTQDNLTDLDGVEADLIVEITDVRGVVATGSKRVTIVVGG